MGLTILGGKGFVGGQYVKDHYDAAVGNITSVNSREDLNVYSPDVLYFISTVHNYNVYTDPLLDINTNLITLVKALENWRARPDNKEGVFNFISSWVVYGNQVNPEGVKEEAICNPKGFYFITKRCAEELLTSYCQAYGLKYRILRLSNNVGPGDTKVSPKKNILQYMVSQLAENKNVQLYGDGLWRRDFMHVADTSRAIDLVITKGAVNEIYNIGNGKTWFMKDILEFCKLTLGSAGEIKPYELNPMQEESHIRTFFMDNSKLKSLGHVSEYTGEKLYRSLCEPYLP